jgi:TolA-binding protein
MKPERDSVDDLLVLARRGDLSTADRQRLRDALASSPETRLLYEAGQAFDMEAPVLAGDDERIEEIERQVQKRLRANSSRNVRRARRFVQAGLAAMLVAGVAVGAVEVARTRAPKNTPTERAPVGPAESPAGLQVPEGVPSKAAPSLVEPTTVLPLVAASAAPAPASPAPAVRPQAGIGAEEPRGGAPAVRVAPDDGLDEALAQPDAPAAAQLSAHDLFVAANAARVRGDVAEAVGQLQMLEQRFPASNEAKTAHLTLGMLHLQKGEAESALQEFRRSEALGAGATMPEALWGESQALRALGRTTDERAVLKNLLRDFPHSAYAGAASKRLGDVP